MRLWQKDDVVEQAGRGTASVTHAEVHHGWGAINKEGMASRH